MEVGKSAVMDFHPFTFFSGHDHDYLFTLVLQTNRRPLNTPFYRLVRMNASLLTISWQNFQKIVHAFLFVLAIWHAAMVSLRKGVVAPIQELPVCHTAYTGPLSASPNAKYMSAVVFYYICACTIEYHMRIFV